MSEFKQSESKLIEVKSKRKQAIIEALGGQPFNNSSLAQHIGEIIFDYQNHCPPIDGVALEEIKGVFLSSHFNRHGNCVAVFSGYDFSEWKIICKSSDEYIFDYN